MTKNTQTTTDLMTETENSAPAFRLPKTFAPDDRQLLKRLLRSEIDFVEHDSFLEPDAEATLLDPAKRMERPNTGWYSRLSHERQADTSLTANNLPLLTPKQEVGIFLQYNYARFRSEQVRVGITGPAVKVAEARELLRWHKLALELRETIAEYNLALVLAMARRLPSHSVDLPEMISEGNMALLRGIDKFNVARGFKFSTYACRAILKAFSRLGVKTSRYRSLFPVGFEPDLERSNYSAERSRTEERDCVEQVSSIFHGNQCDLSELELNVLRKRFSFDNPSERKGMTLQEVGKQVGLTKERVRQIQIHALAKIRETLETTYLDGPSLSDALAEAGMHTADSV